MKETTIMEPVVKRGRFLPWAGVALLGASWLPALGYFQPASPVLASVFVIAGALLMCGATTRAPGRIETALAVVLALPFLLFVPWAYKSGAVLMILGAAALAMTPPRRWAKNLAGGAMSAGVVLIAQSLAILGYESFTARSHELPLPVAKALGGLARILGNDAAVATTTPGGGGGIDIALRTMRKNHHIGATWELLLDPVTLAFATGALVLLLLRMSNNRQANWRDTLWSTAALALGLVLWLPVRAEILMALILHRALRTDFDAPLRVMDVFYSPWALLVLLLPLVLIVWRFSRDGDDANHESASERPPNLFRGLEVWSILSPLLVALAIGTFTFGALYDPIGERKTSGRVIIDEYHTRWEPTQVPFDAKVYGHDSGYNYAAIYDYTSRFYDVARLLGPGVLDKRPPRSTEPMKPTDNLLQKSATTQATDKPATQPSDAPAIDDEVLANCSVFILKCPTARLRYDEIERLKRFVHDGGGLLLVGEHTDVFGLGTNLNDVAKPFGFQFRYDILFNIDEEHPFDYLYNKPLVPHPIVQRMTPLDFEGPCTIEPIGSGRAVMLAVGQHGERAHYYASNFMPPPEDRADSRYGAWVLLWATKYGAGRVVAHADSTQWSNFSAFEAGKPESWMGMIEWLNHRNESVSDPRPILVMLGVLLMIGALFGNRLTMLVKKARNREETAAGQSHASALVMIAAGLCAFTIAARSVRAIHESAMPVPPRSNSMEMINVGVDRAISDAIISKGGFIGGKSDGYGIFERWILRLGWFTQRGGSELLMPSGENKKDLIVYLLPGKDVTQDYRAQLIKYVENGGKILVIDTPENPHSTANSLLKPFGMELKRPYMPITGEIDSKIGLPSVPMLVNPQMYNVYELSGASEVLATMKSDKTVYVVGGTARFGAGSVTAIGFSTRFSDSNMGVTGDVSPGEDLLKLYDWEYGLLRHVMGKPVHEAATQPATKPASISLNR